MIAVSEHYSQVLHSDHGVLRSLPPDEHLGLLNRHVDYLEQLHRWIESLGHTHGMTIARGVHEYIRRIGRPYEIIGAG